jgi:2-aminoadipate transaminase
MNRVPFSNAMDKMSGNVIREILKLTQQPDIISFAGGMPSAEAFPEKELKEIALEVIGKGVLQYGTSEGYGPLRELVVKWVEAKGIKATVDQVLILSGSQQGIDLLAKSFINSNDLISLENPTYLAALQIFNVYQGKFDAIETDSQGPLPESLKRSLELNPKLLYLVPTFQNPTGITISEGRRKELAGIIKNYPTVVVEDDPYGDLRYTGEPVNAIKSLLPNDRSVYLGSFSKIISPGLRVGFAVGPEEIIRKLTVGKQTTDVHTSNLSQAMVFEFCNRGYIKSHLERIKGIYKEKRDLMVEQIKEHFPKEVQFDIADGGLFLWLKLPQNISATELLRETVKDKVAFIPGESFFALGGGGNTMRLNFSNPSLEDISIGIKRLGIAIEKFIK